MAYEVVNYSDGRRYEGELENGYRHGRGIMHYSSGAVYDGEWENGKKHGHGKYTWSGGTVYEGEWKDGCRNGHGKNTFADGRVYDGEWENDKKHGHGKLTYADGVICDGEFEKDKFVKGMKIVPSESVIYEGEFDENKNLVKSKPHKIYRPQGELIAEVAPATEAPVIKEDTYTGSKNSMGQPHGFGVMNYADGTSYVGEWSYGAWYEEGAFIDGKKIYRGTWLGTKKSNNVVLIENGTQVRGVFEKEKFKKI